MPSKETRDENRWRNALLQSLVSLDQQEGVVEQNGPFSLTKRAIGIANPTDIPTYGDISGGLSYTNHTANYVLKGDGSNAPVASIIYDDGTYVNIGTTGQTQKLVVNNVASLIDAGDHADGRKGTIHLVNLTATPASGALGNGISFGAIGSQRRKALISSYQVGADQSTTGLKFFTYDGTTLATNAVTEKLDISLNGIVASVDVSVPDEAYGVSWNGSTEVPTKNAVYDKIEALSLGGGGVLSIDFGTTGLTPNTATTGAVTVAGTLATGNGGTGTNTTFTDGSIVFAGASGNYSQNNGSFFWDRTNKRLGIGINLPDEPLHVDAAGNLDNGIKVSNTNVNAAASARVNIGSDAGLANFKMNSSIYAGVALGGAAAGAALYTTAGATGGLAIGTAAGTMRFYTAGSNLRMTIDASGNVGIGAVPSGTYVLEVSGAASATSLVVADAAYGAGWNGSLEVPTKNAVYDKIESLVQVTDGDKGDITVSASGATWTIDNSAVTLAKMANMATASLIYRKTAGSGAPEVNTLATLKTDLGLTGTNSGDQTSIVGITGTKAEFNTAVTDGNILYVGDVTQYTDEMAQDAVGAMVDTTLVYTDATPLLSRAALTGDVTASAGSNATTIANGAVSLAKMANLSAPSKLIGRYSAGAGAPQEITISTGLSLDGSGNLTSTGGFSGGTLTSNLTLVAGSTTVLPLTFQSGALNTSPTAGVVEYQGTDFFATPHATSGRGLIPVTFGWTYDATGSALGPSIADYFPANSSISLRADQTYEVEAWLYFLKSTAGTVTFTWVASSAPDVMVSSYVGTAAAGFTTTISTATPVHGIAAIRTNASLAHAATASLTSAVYHSYLFRLRIETNAATNLRLRVTSSAGTVTPQVGSYYRVTRMFTTGTFAA